MKDVVIYHSYIDRSIRNYLKDAISRGDNDVVNNVSKRNISGLCKQVIGILDFSLSKPRYDEEHFKGYHIHSQKLTNLKNNALGKIFCDEWFERAYNSTYHANNSSGKSNGYTHWYTFGGLFQRILNNANNDFFNDIKFRRSNQKMIPKEQYVEWVSDDFEFNSYDYIRIKKERYLFECKLHNAHRNNQGYMLYKNVQFCDDKYVYVKNTINADECSLDGLGRNYSLIGLLNKDMRSRILKDFTEFDLDCSIQTIMLNLLLLDTKKKNSFNLSSAKGKYPEFYNLINQKKLFRYRFTSKFKCDYKSAKTIITSLTLSPSSNIIYSYCKDKSPKVIALSKIYIKPFKAESKQLREEILKKFYYQTTDENIFYKIGNLRVGDIPNLIDEEIRVGNTKLRGNGRGKCKEDRILFRLYELIEHQIRNEIIKYLNSVNINEVYQVHDCVLFKNDNIKTIDIEKHVLNTLNLQIKLTGEIL